MINVNYFSNDIEICIKLPEKYSQSHSLPHIHTELEFLSRNHDYVFLDKDVFLEFEFQGVHMQESKVEL